MIVFACDENVYKVIVNIVLKYFVIGSWHNITFSLTLKKGEYFSSFPYNF